MKKHIWITILISFYAIFATGAALFYRAKINKPAVKKVQGKTPLKLAADNVVETKNVIRIEKNEPCPEEVPIENVDPKQKFDEIYEKAKAYAAQVKECGNIVKLLQDSFKK